MPACAGTPQGERAHCVLRAGPAPAAFPVKDQAVAVTGFGAMVSVTHLLPTTNVAAKAATDDEKGTVGPCAITTWFMTPVAEQAQGLGV